MKADKPPVYQGGFCKNAKPINAQVPMQHSATTVTATMAMMETISPESIELFSGSTLARVLGAAGGIPALSGAGSGKGAGEISLMGNPPLLMTE